MPDYLFDARRAALLLIVTLGCTSSCDHCCLSCEPGKASLRLSVEEMSSCIDQALDLGICSVGFTGGEPTIYLSDILPLMRKAHNLGLHVDIRTNASWAKSLSATRDMIRRMKDSGLGRLGFSYDSYHASIPISNLHYAIAVARELHLSFYLDWMSSGKSVEQVSGILGIEYPRELRTVSGPLRVGRAVSLGDEHFSFTSTESLRLCPSWCRSPSHPLVNVFPGGYAAFHPCCWINPALLHRVNLSSDTWMRELAQRTGSSPMVNFLLSRGVTGLIEESPPSHLREKYSYSCDACYDLLGTLFPDEVETDLPGYILDFYGPGRAPAVGVDKCTPMVYNKHRAC